MPRMDAFPTTVSALSRAQARVTPQRRRHPARTRELPPTSDGLVRETFSKPQSEAREHAKSYLERFPREAYWTRVEHWRRMADGTIEFTMVRLPTAD